MPLYVRTSYKNYLINIILSLLFTIMLSILFYKSKFNFLYIHIAVILYVFFAFISTFRIIEIILTKKTLDSVGIWCLFGGPREITYKKDGGWFLIQVSFTIIYWLLICFGLLLARWS